MYCYILQSEKSGRFYVGHAESLEARSREHNRGHVVATGNKGPWKIIYSEQFATRREAAARKREIKSWKSALKICTLIGLERPDNREGR